MEEYNKWVFGEDNWIRDEFAGAEAGWRAALEWVLKMDFIHAMDKSFLLRKIRQELGINENLDNKENENN